MKEYYIEVRDFVSGKVLFGDVSGDCAILGAMPAKDDPFFLNGKEYRVHKAVTYFSPTRWDKVIYVTPFPFK